MGGREGGVKWMRGRQEGVTGDNNTNRVRENSKEVKIAGRILTRI